MSCDWPIAREVLPPLPELGENPSPDQQAAFALAQAQRNSAEDLAVAILWALSGRRYGVCDTIARPCPPPSLPTGYTGYSTGSTFDILFPIMLWDGEADWVDTACGCSSQCRRTGPGMVHLPGPVVEVTKVTIGDTDLNSAGWVLEGGVLYRRGDSVVWPDQNMSRPMGEPGTWSVTYKRGVPVPPGVDLLTGLFAKEFVLAYQGNPQCRITRSLTGLVRQGVSHTFDPQKFITAGLTGIEEVDSWIASVNPNRLQQPPSVQ